MWGEATVIQIAIEISVLILLIIGALIGVIYRAMLSRFTGVHTRIDKLEENKVDKVECKAREKHEDATFGQINQTLNKIESTFDSKSTDVVGTMEDILDLLDKRKRRARR